MKHVQKRNQAEMLRQYSHNPLSSSFDRSEYAKMVADHSLDYERIAFPRVTPEGNVERTYPFLSADDSTTPTPGIADSSNSTSTSTSTPTSMTPSTSDYISVSPSHLRRRLTASEIAARNAESHRQQFNSSMGLRIYQSIENYQTDSAQAEVDARLWKQYIND